MFGRTEHIAKKMNTLSPNYEMSDSSSVWERNNKIKAEIEKMLRNSEQIELLQIPGQLNSFGKFNLDRYFRKFFP